MGDSLYGMDGYGVGRYSAAPWEYLAVDTSFTVAATARVTRLRKESFADSFVVSATARATRLRKFSFTTAFTVAATVKMTPARGFSATLAFTVSENARLTADLSMRANSVIFFDMPFVDMDTFKQWVPAPSLPGDWTDGTTPGDPWNAAPVEVAPWADTVTPDGIWVNTTSNPWN